MTVSPSRILALLLALAALPAGTALAKPAKAPAALPGPSAVTIATRVQAFYERTQTFRADFKQRYTMRGYGKKKDSRGTVFFQKPGKMSWHYSNNANRVVSDGKQLSVYEADNKQLYKQAVAQSQSPAALSFLAGAGKLTDEFNLRRLDSAKLKFQGGYVLVGTPKTPTPAYQKVLMYIDAKTFQVRRMMLIDAQRNRNRFDFINTIVNKPIQASEFRFQAPPGTRIIKP